MASGIQEPQHRWHEDLVGLLSCLQRLNKARYDVKHFFELAVEAFAVEGLGVRKHAELRARICQVRGSVELPLPYVLFRLSDIIAITDKVQACLRSCLQAVIVCS